MTARTIVFALLYCLCMALGVAACVYHEAGRWEFFDFSHLVHLSCFIFAVAAGCALVFDSVAAIRVPRIISAAAVLCGILTASVLYSWAHGDIVLVVWPSLFCAPGAIAGYIAADVMAMAVRQVTAARAKRMPRRSGTPAEPGCGT